MKRTQAFITANRSYISAAPLKPTGIVVHSTGVNQKKISAYWRQFNSATLRASVHGFIGLDDDGELTHTQTLPYNIQCWGCGAGVNGSFNKSHIQIEICEDLNDGEWCRQTYNAMLQICAELCAEYDIKPENVVCHCEAYKLGYGSNHADVMHWWSKYGLSMDKFRKDLADMGFIDTETHWAKPYIEKCVDAGLMKGKTETEFDPDAPITRAEVATVFARLLDKMEAT